MEVNDQHRLTAFCRATQPQLREKAFRAFMISTGTAEKVVAGLEECGAMVTMTPIFRPGSDCEVGDILAVLVGYRLPSHDDVGLDTACEALIPEIQLEPMP